MTTPISRTEGTRWTMLTFISPVLSAAMLDVLAEHLVGLARSSPNRPVVLASSHRSIFLAGAHLAEIAELDEASCVAYARRGRAVIAALRDHPAPTVAAVDGSCSGGGFDLVLGCDLIVAGRLASFSHPGVQRGLVTGWGGTVEVPGAVGRAHARHALLQGRAFTAAELVALGVAAPARTSVVESATAVAVDLAELHPGRISSWRRLRGGGRPDHCGIVASPAIIDQAIPPDGSDRRARQGASDRTGRRPGRPHDQDDPARR